LFNIITGLILCKQISTYHSFPEEFKKGLEIPLFGAKESTQNFLFLFVFNKLKFLSRFVHVLYKNGRQKAVFT